MLHIENQLPAQIKLYQEHRLKTQLEYLQLHSPFYKSLFRDNKIAIDKIEHIEDLTKIPATTKDHFSNYNFDFLCVPKNKVVDYATTSGTTGSPVTIALTENDLQRLAENEYRSFMCAGAQPDDVFQLMLTLDKQFMAGMAYFLGIRKLGAGAVRVGPASPHMQWENILRFKPTAIVAVPSFIIKLIDYAEANGIKLSDSGIQRAVCIGEPLRKGDLSPNTLSNRISERWDIQLFSTYASTEMQTAFTECDYGCGNHHQPELVIVEILDDEGNQLPENEFGEVTITTLGVEGMPLLRYRTGDICCFYSEPCGCGRNTIRLSPVVGRKNQMIKYNGTTLFPPSIYDALSSVPEVKDYVVEVLKNELGNDDIVLHISQGGNLDVVEEKLKHALQAKIRVMPKLNFVPAQYLQSIRPAESRKPVMIIFR